MNLSFQIHVFMNTKEINASPESLMKLLNLYKDFNFLPSTMHELNGINPVPVLRPRMASPDNEWSVSILSERITIDRNYNGFPITMDAFLEKAIAITELFMRDFDKKGKRISFISREILPDMNKEKIDSIYNIFTKPAGMHSDTSPFEWNLRTVRRLNFRVNNTIENVNFITNVGRQRGSIIQNDILNDVDRVYIEYDINTAGENENERFSTEDVKDFITQAAAGRKEEMMALEGLING